MGSLSDIGVSLLTAFTVSASGVSEAAPDVAAAAGPSDRSNLIDVLKSECQENDHILLGDTNHADPSISFLMADPNVLQAMHDCDGTLVLEAGMAQNEKYPEQIEVDMGKVKGAIFIVQAYLKTNGYENITPNSRLNLETTTALHHYISAEQDRVGIEHVTEGFYTQSLGEVLAEEWNDHTPDDGFRKSFLDSLEYLKVSLALPEADTLAKKYQDLAEGYINRTGQEYSENSALSENMKTRAQAEFDRTHYAAQIGLPLVYPDPRHNELADDQEVAEHLHRFLFSDPIVTTQEKINLYIYRDALSHSDLDIRSVDARLSVLLEDSITVPINAEIVENAVTLSTTPKMFMLYGAAHMSEENDVNEMLGDDNTTSIMLFSDSDTEIFFGHPDDPRADTYGSDLPEYMYNIETDTVTQIIEGTPSEDAYRNKIRYSATPEEYQIAVDALSPELREYALPYSEYDADYNNNVIPYDWLETDTDYRAVTSPSSDGMKP